MTKKLEHRGKSTRCLPRLKNPFKRNDLLQKRKNLFEKNSAFKKAYKFQWKNAHSTVLQNAWSQKPMLFIEKNNFTIKNQCFSLKTILDNKKT